MTTKNNKTLNAATIKNDECILLEKKIKLTFFFKIVLDIIRLER